MLNNQGSMYNYSSCCFWRIFDKSSFKDRFILAHSLRAQSIMAGESVTIRFVELWQLLIASAVRKHREVKAAAADPLSPLFFFISFETSDCGMVPQRVSGSACLSEPPYKPLTDLPRGVSPKAIANLIRLTKQNISTRNLAWHIYNVVPKKYHWRLFKGREMVNTVTEK